MGLVHLDIGAEAEQTKVVAEGNIAPACCPGGVRIGRSGGTGLAGGSAVGGSGSKGPSG